MILNHFFGRVQNARLGVIRTPLHFYKRSLLKHSYTAKSRQVKDAQWVIHTLTSQYPRFSSSRIKHKMADIYNQVQTSDMSSSDIVNK